MKLQFLLSFLFISLYSFGQTGTVTGVILDKEFNNEPLPFANIVIKGTTIGTSTDDMGKYTLSVKPGSYVLEIGYLGYETKEIPFTIKAGEKKVINHTLEASGVQLQDVVITHSVTKESEQALLQEQQKAVEIKQAIGAEEISKKGISDVASAVTKTTGITKQEGSGNIYVRGLGDRYNTTTMNGLPLPSNNPTKKNISLDIFSTDIVEYIGIDKTFNYKNYGDFAGANIDIVSKNYKGSGTLEIGTGFGVNSNAIKQDKFYLQDGPSFHGFSNQKYPNNPFSGYNFNTSWDKRAQTPINSSFYLRGGDSYSVSENGKLSFFINSSFDNGYTFKEGVSRGSVNVQGVAKRDLFKQSYNYQTNTNLMANVNYKINNNNNLRFNSMYINSSNQKHEEYTGIIDIFDIAANGGGFIRRSTFERTSLLVNQLLGEHTFSDRIDLNWGTSYNMMKNIVPDRMQNTFIPVNDNGDLSNIKVAENNQSENHRYYQEMTDDEVAANANLSYKFSKDGDKYKGKVIAGYSIRYKKLNFDATQFNFDIQTVAQPTIDLNNIDGYFNQNNFNAGLFVIETFNGGLGDPNALNPQNFNGQQIISAGYGAIEYQFNPKLYVIAGFRSEFIIQDIKYKTALAPQGGKKNFDTMEYLPMITAKYELNEKQNLKIAASKTYTLPQFKERAPFQFEEVNQVYFGNPYLYNSTDYNFDLKWEFFPKSGEIISLTTFGKYIQNPINEVTVASATNDISYVNSGEKAIGLGAEIEFRKNILSRENLSTNEKTDLSFGLNISYMNTNQDFDKEKVLNETEGTINVAFTEKEGKLTGASDLLINSDISFSKDFKNDSGLQSTLAFSYFSDRNFAIGSYGKGNLIDSKVGTFDFVLKYKLNKNLGLGFTVKNITNPTIERYQDIQNVVVDSYKKGQNYSFSLKYEF
ncbi:TonB-dependent receptor [Flavobacterium sp. 316]|uniref:TonB-dependent receptor n=1 Tax=Flavobacterium sp. 316 TaxID=1603293 RepID=UPI0005E7A6BA|nr:TonB-dependent receptor [Flavobacterium sp. 316]KIX21035.1 TonB-dependent receptor [Flavobacterium sp. 316]